MNKTPVKNFIFFILIFYSISSRAQSTYPYSKFPYNFIRYDKNSIIFPGDSSDFEKLYSKLDTIIFQGKGKINIVHIGGSHIQSGIYSGRTRERLQTFYPGLNGGRGMVFPYRMSRTNSPNNYNVNWTGEWTTLRNVQHTKSGNLGMLGISATTYDSTASIKVVTGKNYLHYDFNSVRIFTDFSKKSFKIIPDYKGKYTISEFPEKGFIQINFDNYIDTLSLKIHESDSIQNYFTLYGISLDNDNSGIVYTDAGINGASLPSFLKCNLLALQMKQIEPDLVIISLGTNDTYTKNFVPSYYKQNYINFIAEIKKANPDAAILLTVPNDDYYRRRYPNRNIQEAEDVILELAKEYGYGVWNFYQIMGGFNSSSLWYKDFLMAYDRIHFTTKGYLIKGDLLFFAILKSYDNHIDNKNKKRLP